MYEFTFPSNVTLYGAPFVSFMIFTDNEVPIICGAGRQWWRKCKHVSMGHRPTKTSETEALKDMVDSASVAHESRDKTAGLHAPDAGEYVRDELEALTVCVSVLLLMR